MMQILQSQARKMENQSSYMAVGQHMMRPMGWKGNHRKRLRAHIIPYVSSTPTPNQDQFAASPLGEPFINSMQKLLASVEDKGARNVRVYNDDATQLLDWLPDGCLDQIDLLYPDPWPKRKHWKRRFVSQTNLKRFHRVLKPGGLFCFASDIDTYVNWTLLKCRDHGGFDWLASNAADWLTPYEGWPSTRYEAKARREGRSSAYLTFKKI